MENIDPIVEKLNKFLKDKNPDFKQFEEIIKQIKEQEKLRIRILDFEYNDEERLNHAVKEKIIAVKSYNFERAASWRDKEKEIQKYIDLKKTFKIKKSMFYFQGDYLVYFYFGNAKNDKEIKEFLKECLTPKPRV